MTGKRFCVTGKVKAKKTVDFLLTMTVKKPKPNIRTVLQSISMTASL